MSQYDDNEPEECSECGYPEDECQCCEDCGCYPCQCEDEEDVGLSLADAFDQLEREGFIAKENYYCCQGCAGCAVTNLAEDMIDNGADQNGIKGCVFYHNQDDDNRRKGENFYLAFGPMESAKYGQIGLSHEQVGKRVIQVLTAHSVIARWSGKPDERILVCQEEK